MVSFRIQGPDAVQYIAPARDPGEAQASPNAFGAAQGAALEQAGHVIAALGETAFTLGRKRQATTDDVAYETYNVEGNKYYNDTTMAAKQGMTAGAPNYYQNLQQTWTKDSQQRLDDFQKKYHVSNAGMQRIRLLDLKYQGDYGSKAVTDGNNEAVRYLGETTQNNIQSNIDSGIAHGRWSDVQKANDAALKAAAPTIGPENVATVKAKVRADTITGFNAWAKNFTTTAVMPDQAALKATTDQFNKELDSLDLDQGAKDVLKQTHIQNLALTYGKQHPEEVSKLATPTTTTAPAAGAKAMAPVGDASSAAFGSDGQLSDVYSSRLFQLESGGNWNAHNPSGADGPAQIMPATARAYGVTNTRDPAQVKAFLQKFTSDNAAYLRKRLGREPTQAELYLAHQQGPKGAVALLTAEPGQKATDVLGYKAVMQNGGAPGMSAQAFANLWINKFNGVKGAPITPSYGEGIRQTGGEQGPGIAPYTDTGTAMTATDQTAAPSYEVPANLAALGVQPDTWVQMQADASAQLNAQETARKAQIAAAEKQAQAASDAAAMGYANRIIAGDPADMAKIPQEIINDPALNKTDKIQMNTMLETAMKRTGKEYHSPGYRAASGDILSDPAAPGHIDTASQVWARTNVSESSPAYVSPEDAKRLVEELTQVKSGKNDTTGGANVVQTKNAQLDRVKLLLAPGGANDAQGLIRYNNFVGAFNSQFDAFMNAPKKDGKPPNAYDFLQPENVDKIMAPYQRTPAQIAQDTIAATPATTATIASGWKGAEDTASRELTGPPAMPGEPRQGQDAYDLFMQRLHEGYDKFIAVPGANPNDYLSSANIDRLMVEYKKSPDYQQTEAGKAAAELKASGGVPPDTVVPTENFRGADPVKVEALTNGETPQWHNPQTNTDEQMSPATWSHALLTALRIELKPVNPVERQDLIKQWNSYYGGGTITWPDGTTGPTDFHQAINSMMPDRIDPGIERSASAAPSNLAEARTGSNATLTIGGGPPALPTPLTPDQQALEAARQQQQQTVVPPLPAEKRPYPQGAGILDEAVRRAPQVAPREPQYKAPPEQPLAQRERVPSPITGKGRHVSGWNGTLPNVGDLMAPSSNEDLNDPSSWGARGDGSQKGLGFLGVLLRSDGKIASEMSVSDPKLFRGREFPLLVPTLTRAEVVMLLNLKAGAKLPEAIMRKAEAFAKARIAAGMSPFAGPDESPTYANYGR